MVLGVVTGLRHNGGECNAEMGQIIRRKTILLLLYIRRRRFSGIFFFSFLFYILLFLSSFLLVKNIEREYFLVVSY